MPVIGNFAGPKALRAVGRYIRDHGATVSAFYVSNVEQYLFQDGSSTSSPKNVATLPVDDWSTFIRSVSSRFGYGGRYLWTDGRASALDPIRAFVRDAQAGKMRLRGRTTTSNCTVKVARDGVHGAAVPDACGKRRGFSPRSCWPAEAGPLRQYLQPFMSAPGGRVLVDVLDIFVEELVAARAPAVRRHRLEHDLAA